MHKEAAEELRVRFKLAVIAIADQIGAAKASKEFNVPRSMFYRWKKQYKTKGRSGLYREKPVAYHHPRKTSPEDVEKIMELRQEYQLGALRIKYYPDRYHGIRISESTVSRVLSSRGVSRLPKTAPKRALHTKRYAKRSLGTRFRWM